MSGYSSAPNVIRRSMIPTTDNTYDVGSGSFRVKDYYGAGNIYLNGAGKGIQVLNNQAIHADLTAYLSSPPAVLLGNSGSYLSIASSGNDAGSGGIAAFKTRSTGTDANVIVQSGDLLFSLSVFGSDGVDYQPAAGIQFSVDGTPGAGDLPGRIGFFTTPDGSASSVESWRINNAGNWVGMQTSNAFITNTTDGADNQRIQIIAGGAATGSLYTRGASIDARGNEYASAGGYIEIASGDFSGASVVLSCCSTNGDIRFGNVAGNNFWRFDCATGNFEQGATSGGNIVFAKSFGLICQNTSNGTDNQSVTICGGGTPSSVTDVTRGGIITLRGNEHSTAPGNIEIRTGDTSTADLTLVASDDILFVTNSLNAWRFNSDQSLTYEQTASIIHAEGSTTYGLQICGGITASAGSGSRVEVYGHTHATQAGNVSLYAGQAAGASVRLSLASTSGLIRMTNSAGANMLTVDDNHIMNIINTPTPPAGTPSLSGYLYVDSGALKYKGSSGTVTTVAPA